MKQFTILRNDDPDSTGGGGLISGVVSNPAGDSSMSGGAAQTQEGKFDFRSLVGDDGRFTSDWTDRLPEGLKEHKAHFSKYADPVQALQHTLNLQQLLGKKAEAVVIPSSGAPKEDWAPVLKRLGVPDSPEGYGLKAPENLPEGVKLNEDDLKGFANLAHEIGLTPQQVAKLQEYDLGRAGKMAESGKENVLAMEKSALEEQRTILVKAWGNGPEAKQKEAMAERAALTFGFTPEEVKSDPLFRNARFVMTLARAGAAMSEDTLVKSSEVTSIGGLKAKAQDIISNPNNSLYKKYWEGDQETNNQVQAWMRASS